jgi:serine protease Do
VQEIGPQLAEYFAAENGVLVTSVTEESPGAEAGLKAGDVITSVDDWPIDEVADLRLRLLRVEPGEIFEIAVVRDKEAMTLEATLDDDEVEPRRLRLRGSRRPL